MQTTASSLAGALSGRARAPAAGRRLERAHVAQARCRRGGCALCTRGDRTGAPPLRARNLLGCPGEPSLDLLRPTSFALAATTPCRARPPSHPERFCKPAGSLRPPCPVHVEVQRPARYVPVGVVVRKDRARDVGWTARSREVARKRERLRPSGSRGSAMLSPSASRPQRSHVEGMNCIQPTAPGELGPDVSTQVRFDLVRIRREHLPRDPPATMGPLPEEVERRKRELLWIGGAGRVGHRQ